MIRRIVFIVISLTIIGICYIYCAPITKEVLIIGKNPIINGLVINGGYCLLITYLAKKDELIKMNDKSGNRLAYIPYVFTFIYCGISFFSLIAIIWSKQFYLAFTIIPAFISIECVIYVNRIMKIQNQKE